MKKVSELKEYAEKLGLGDLEITHLVDGVESSEGSVSDEVFDTFCWCMDCLAEFEEEKKGTEK